MFFKSELGKQSRQELLEMAESKDYNTRTMYSTSEKDGLSFVDKHMKYMSLYPNLDCRQYVQNLRLMTKIRK